MKRDGFTLIEMLVALLIFGMISAASVALLRFSVLTQETADAKLADVAGFRKTGALLTSDLAQAARRLTRDSTGAYAPAFAGSSGEGGQPLLAFVRRGWENFDGAPRSTLQKVEYRFAEGRLERTAYPLVDGTAPLAPAVVAEDIASVRLRFRDDNGDWRERWDPEQASDIPAAVEMILDVEGGAVRQLFLTGIGQ